MMKRTASGIGRTLTLVGALLAPTAPLLAQDAPAAAGKEAASKEIVVEAPRSAPLPPTAGRDPYTSAPVITTTVRITALYGDLNLASPADVARLRSRIERVAQAACRQLDRLQPLGSDPDCVSTAVAKTRPALDAAVTAAGR